jgi:hypothetical protein
LIDISLTLAHHPLSHTAIEVLSPVNKRSSHEAYHDYLRKRRQLLHSEAHVIEINLLRGGERPPLAGPVPSAPYAVYERGAYARLIDYHLPRFRRQKRLG